MKTVGYYRGGDPEAVVRIMELARRKGLEVEAVFSDPDGEYSAFRRLQTLVKREVVGTVIVSDPSSLGGDRYRRIENVLFFMRNGVRLVAPSNLSGDPRRSIVTAVRRFNSFVAQWDENSGLTLPQIKGRDRKLTNLPFGYRAEGGAAVIETDEAETVRMIFERYAEGFSPREILLSLERSSPTSCKGFSTMTIKALLGNRHYLGNVSRKGVQLPAIIDYGTWLRAKERLAAEYGEETELAPFFTKISADRPFSFTRNGRGDLGAHGLHISSEALENALVGFIKELASEDAARELYEGFVLPELARAEKAFPAAAEQLNRVTASFRKLLNSVKNGDYSQSTQDELERLTDLKNVYSMRLRRISTEKELFSVTQDEIDDFFSRARRMEELSREEKSLISEAFVKAVRISERAFCALLVSPSSAKSIKREID